MGIKILHCADIHIGFEMSKKQLGTLRSAEVLSSFLRLLDFAQSENIELLLICGDLFDSHHISGDILNQVAKKFAEFSGKIVISPGNHDYYAENSVWEPFCALSNTIIFKNPHDCILLENLGVRLVGGAFSGAYKTEHVLKNLDLPNDNYINIGVFHGELSDASPYGPITVPEIENSGLDYLALGHIHKRTDILKSGKTAYSYCGCLEGQGFDETGEKGFYVGEIGKGSANLAFHPFELRRFITETVDISDCADFSEVSESILQKLNQKYKNACRNWFFKITLTGSVAFSVNTDLLRAQLENYVFYAKIKDKTTDATIDINHLAQDNSLKGIFVRKMLEKSNDEFTKDALLLGLRAFSEEVFYNED